MTWWADQHPQGEEYDEAVDAFGHLSVDQNQEVRSVSSCGPYVLLMLCAVQFRYHGRSAGLHLLAKSDRTDDSQQAENGIWSVQPILSHSPASSLSDVVTQEVQHAQDGS